MTLNREQILAAIETRAKDVTPIEVPEWGGSVNVRKMTVEEAEETGLSGDAKTSETVANVLAASLTDADAQLLFTAEDVKALAQVDMAVAARVFAEIVKLNGMGGESLEEAIQTFTDAQPGSSSTS